MSKDIKEKRRDRATIKEKRASPPKALLKKGAIYSASYAKQQITSAAQSGAENEEAEQSSVSGVDIIQNFPIQTNPQRRKSKSKEKTQEHYHTHSTDSNTTLNTNRNVSTNRTEPVFSQRSTIQQPTDSSQLNAVDITLRSETPSQKSRNAQNQMVQKRAARKTTIHVES